MCSGVLATRLNCAPRLGISSSEHLIDFEVGSRKEGSEKFSSRMLLLLYAVSVYYLFPVTLLWFYIINDDFSRLCGLHIFLSLSPNRDDGVFLSLCIMVCHKAVSLFFRLVIFVFSFRAIFIILIPVVYSYVWNKSIVSLVEFRYYCCYYYANNKINN